MLARGLSSSVIRNQPKSIVPKERRSPSNKVSPVQSTASVQKIGSSGVPKQLLQLAFADQITIRQKKELMDATLGYEVENRYDIYNEYNQRIYTAEECSECDTDCLRSYCGALNLVVKIKDLDGNKVISCQCPLPLQEVCCLQSMNVWLWSGKGIGRIKQKWGYRSELHIVNDEGNTGFIINGPPRHFHWNSENVEFPIFEPDGETECGRILKRRGFLHRAFNFTNSDTFGVRFPPGCSPSMKALLVGATFLVDYMYLDGRCHGGGALPKDSSFDI